MKLLKESEIPSQNMIDYRVRLVLDGCLHAAQLKPLARI